jgi:hypothetical protein
LKNANFTALGLNPGRPRSVVFFYSTRKLGKVVHLKGDEKAPFTVRLEPLSAVSGRIVDGAGQPRAGLRVMVTLQDRPHESADLPWTDLFQGGLAPLLSVGATTDRDGDFRIAGLLPGVPYLLRAYERGESDKPVVSVDVDDLKSAATKALGDLPSKQASDERPSK